jgi:predicted deacylase
LGRNANGYLGETIEIAAVLADCLAAGREHGWLVDTIHAAPKPDVVALRRPARSEGETKRVYISTGIHGDEPAGPLAARQLLQEHRWPDTVSLWLCPCLNPAGFAVNRRENADGRDLNRQYLNPKAEETVAHIRWLREQPRFDLCLCLHEDWESDGFYVYELNPDNRPSLAEAIVSAVARVCPVDRSETIEGRPAREGVIRPSLDPRSRPDWPEAFFLLTHKTSLSYTLEAPSDFPLPTRVAVLVAGARAALETHRAK